MFVAIQHVKGLWININLDKFCIIRCLNNKHGKSILNLNQILLHAPFPVLNCEDIKGILNKELAFVKVKALKFVKQKKFYI